MHKNSSKLLKHLHLDKYIENYQMCCNVLSKRANSAMVE